MIGRFSLPPSKMTQCAKLMSRDMMFALSIDRSTAKVKEEKLMYVGMKDETLHFCKPLPCLHFI